MSANIVNAPMANPSGRGTILAGAVAGGALGAAIGKDREPVKSIGPVEGAGGRPDAWLFRRDRARRGHGRRRDPEGADAGRRHRHEGGRQAARSSDRSGGRARERVFGVLNRAPRTIARAAFPLLSRIVERYRPGADPVLRYSHSPGDRVGAHRRIIDRGGRAATETVRGPRDGKED